MAIFLKLCFHFSGNNQNICPENNGAPVVIENSYLCFYLFIGMVVIFMDIAQSYHMSLNDNINQYHCHPTMFVKNQKCSLDLLITTGHCQGHCDVIKTTVETKHCSVHFNFPDSGCLGKIRKICNLEYGLACQGPYVAILQRHP